MFLFLNTISSPSTAFLFDDRNILHRVGWDSKLREYDTLLPKLDELFAMTGVSARDLKWIVCVNGPGSFTGMRTTVLTVNSLAYAHGMPIMPLDVFELGNLLGWPYPRILTINSRESGIKLAPAEDMEILANDLVSPGIYHGYSQIGSQNPQIVVESCEPYERLIESLVFRGISRINPLYVKRPNITVSHNLRKRTSLLQ